MPEISPSRHGQDKGESEGSLVDAALADLLYALASAPLFEYVTSPTSGAPRTTSNVASSVPIFLKPSIRPAGNEIVSHGPSSASPVPSSPQKNFHLPLNGTNTSTILWLCSGAPAPGCTVLNASVKS